jgi:hypothetical protein
MDIQDDDVIDFDSTIENDGEGFTILPNGDEVEYEIKEIEKGRNADGTKPMVKIKLVATSTKGLGRTSITDSITMSRKSEWKLCEFFTSMGMRKHGEKLQLNWDLVGAKGRATVSVDEWVGRDGEKRKSNKIKHYLIPLPESGDACFM